MTKKRQKPEQVGGDHVEITIGDHASYVVAGKNIRQVVAGQQAQVQVSEADLAEVCKLFAELRQKVEAEAPPDKKSSALERVKELEEAVTAKKPDLTTMEYVKKWFSKHLPQLAGAVVSVLVNPIVGKIVQAAGDIAAGELKRRFGTE